MEKHDKLWSGCLFVFVAVIFAVQIPSIKLTTIAGTSRLLPTIVCVMLFAFGLPLIVQGLMELRAEKSEKKDNDGKPEMPFIVRYGKVFISAALFAFYAFTLTRLGFIVSSSIYLISMYYIMAPKDKYKHVLFIILGIAIPVFLYFVFVKGFRVILPIGTIWR